MARPGNGCRGKPYWRCRAADLPTEGDVARAKGDTTAATQAYESASAIRPSPVTQKKIEAVKLSKSRKVHH
jgi:predicted negative regulator of RcsB-dependent stress response